MELMLGGSIGRLVELADVCMNDADRGGWGWDGVGKPLV